MSRMQCDRLCASISLDQFASFDATITHLHAFIGRQGACRRAQHLGAIGTHHAKADLAHGFEHLRRDDDIKRARHRIQAQHRAPCSQLVLFDRENLDVIGGGAGALRHPGYRGALNRVAGHQGGLDQPLAQHSAALASQCAYQYANGARLYCGCLCCGCHQLSSSARSSGARSQAPKRSKGFGLVITSAR